MIARIKSGTRIAASYANGFGELFAAEARRELQRLTDWLKQKVVAMAFLLLGFVWLNVGVFVLIWDSPYRRWMPFAIGVGATLIALLVWLRSNHASREPAFVATRQALAEDAALWNIDLLPSHVLANLDPGHAQGGHEQAAQARATQRSADEPSGKHAQAAATTRTVADRVSGGQSPTVEALEAQLRELRLALKRTVSGQRASQAGSAFFSASGGAAEGGLAAKGFVPKSRTMRTLMAFAGDGNSGGARDDKWPLAVASALVASGLLKRRGRWLIGAWPVLRFAIKVLGRTRAATPERGEVGASSQARSTRVNRKNQE